MAATATQPTIDPNGLYDIGQVAAAFGVCSKTVYRWIDACDLPKPFKQGRRYYWRGVTLIAHCEGLRAVA